MPHKSTVLIVGATGFIGGLVTKKFSESQDFEVVALVRSLASDAAENLKPLCKTIEKQWDPDHVTKDEIERLIVKHNVKVVINTSVYTPKQDTVQKQVELEKETLEAVLHGAQSVSPNIFVITTSGNSTLITAHEKVVTGDPKPVDVERPPYMKWLDFGAKTNASKDQITIDFIKNHEGNACIMYPGMIFGPSPTRPGVIDWCIQQHILGTEFEGMKPYPPNYVTTWIHSADLGECYVQAARKKPKGEFFLIAGFPMSYGEMASLLAKAAGIPFEPTPCVNEGQITYDDSKTKQILDVNWENPPNEKSMKEWMETMKKWDQWRIGDPLFNSEKSVQ